MIIIHPFPKKYMHSYFEKPPKPSVLNDYKRAGATITLKGKQCWIRFDEESLRHFYLRDVLLHELGHHTDAGNFRTKSRKKAENFAECSPRNMDTICGFERRNQIDWGCLARLC